jgi:hypothetical protein
MGADDECRSEERTHARDGAGDSKQGGRVFAMSDERGGSPAPRAEHSLQQMGEAPVKYELTGAS